MINNKTILLTGGTGSFGKEFTKTLLNKFKKNNFKLFIFSRDELKQFEMNNEISDGRINYIIGDIRDYERLSNLNIKPNFIVHAAAMKQIVASELNPSECINTNILGTQNLLRYSSNFKNCKFLSLSTDKAVNPVNLYGATKLSLEKITLANNNLSMQNNNSYSVLRYGNVIGSRGSVIPFFKSRKKLNKPIPVTHKDMTRFWITLNQAANLAINCLRIMQGSEIFVPKLPSFKILDLAKSFDSEIFFSGIRKGEKLHEALIAKEEKRNCYFCKKENVFLIKDFSSKKKLKLSNYIFEKVKDDYLDYDSNINDQIMSISDLKKIIK